jgi:hypothetical protein
MPCACGFPVPRAARAPDTGWRKGRTASWRWPMGRAGRNRMLAPGMAP